jgi:hypothetical protein
MTSCIHPTLHRFPFLYCGKAIFVEAWTAQEVEAPTFHNNWHMKVGGLSALCTQEIFLVLIFGRGLVNTRAIGRPVGLSQ